MRLKMVRDIQKYRSVFNIICKYLNHTNFFKFHFSKRSGVIKPLVTFFTIHRPPQPHPSPSPSPDAKTKPKAKATATAKAEVLAAIIQRVQVFFVSWPTLMIIEILHFGNFAQILPNRQPQLRLQPPSFQNQYL